VAITLAAGPRVAAVAASVAIDHRDTA